MSSRKKQHEKNQKEIQVCAHWQGIKDPIVVGTLYVSPGRRKEIFSFEYSPSWLASSHAQVLDPDLHLFTGPQYVPEGQENFGLFLDSSPDRWGRVLMQRREVYIAQKENRTPNPLLDSDYLLGVYDGHRMGGMRFRLSEESPFLDNKTDMASPPWAKLRDLEYASLQIERSGVEDEKDYMKWLQLLIQPGGSLGGARPKASVIDEKGHPWIAKFPSHRDGLINVGKWEYLVYMMAVKAGIDTAPSQIRRFSGVHDTFLTKRFDRTGTGERIHFSSAMTMLGKKDGDGAETGVSYLEIASFLMRNGAQVKRDLEQLWRRIVFYICVSNTDDHLRNHGFLLTDQGWVLSPAYDINPNAYGNGLSLNISEDDNNQSLDLARSVAHIFRINTERMENIIAEIQSVVREWPKLAEELKIPGSEVSLMQNAFMVTDLSLGKQI